MVNPITGRLRDLPLIDLYVPRHDYTQAHFRAAHKPGFVADDIDVPTDYHADLEQLARQLQVLMQGDECAVHYDGVRYRASRLVMASGQEWTVLRRIPDAPPKLETLGFQDYMLPILKEIGRRDGLVVLAGSTGAGKTTSAASLLAHYLENYGHVAFTVEDPVEYNLEGKHGKRGFCYQVEASGDDDWGVMLKRSLRWQPRYIMVGEVRTPDAAAQVLRMATSGHLVITTIHGGSIAETLEGLVQLADQDMKGQACQLLATGLTAVIHQQLKPQGLVTKSIFTEAGNMGDAARNIIREQRIGLLATLIESQEARLRNGGRLFVPVANQPNLRSRKA